jgi:predicted DsbA family dithiol-disulfide isomerase
LQENHAVDVEWIAFPLHPDTPEEGLELNELFAGRNYDIGEMMTRLKRAAAEEGLPFGNREKTYNSRLAQELAKWAEAQGKGDAFHKAAFRAYFADGKNIGKIHNLVDLAQSLKLSGKAAQKALETRAFKEAVDRDWIHSRKLGITAVPTFMCNGEAVVGAQPYEILEALVKTNKARKLGQEKFC